MGWRQVEFIYCTLLIYSSRGLSGSLPPNNAMVGACHMYLPVSEGSVPGNACQCGVQDTGHHTDWISSCSVSLASGGAGSTLANQGHGWETVHPVLGSTWYHLLLPNRLVWRDNLFLKFHTEVSMKSFQFLLSQFVQLHALPIFLIG